VGRFPSPGKRKFLALGNRPTGRLISGIDRSLTPAGASLFGLAATFSFGLLPMAAARSRSKNAAQVDAPTRSKLKRWSHFEKKRLALQAQSRDIAKLQNGLESEFLAYVQAEAGKERCLVRFGYRLLIKDKRENVSWKGEFLKEHGEAAAIALTESQPTKETLVIEEPVA
jgi:hypothetical protein